MALTLTPGREMRLDGAPDLRLPNEEDIIDSLAAEMLANDELGVLYLGDKNRARAAAAQKYQAMVQQQQAQRAASEAAAAQSNAARNTQRAAVRGVDPESLPADEYGAVSRQTVREANRSPEDAEAALMQDQDLADQITAGLRTGDQNWQAEADRQYSQEYGLGGFEYGPGQTDLDIRRRIQDQQGFIRTQQGMVPMGRDPTPEQIASYRDFHYDWANETPGTERQARYNPEAYEEFREGVRNDIRDRAQDEMATYGTGPAWKLEEKANAPLEAPNASVAGFVAGLGTGSAPAVGGPFVSPSLGNQELDRQQTQAQLAARAARGASEDRVAEAEREVRIARLARQAGVTRAEARAMMDKERAGMQPADAAPLPLNVAQRRQETQGLRDMAGSRRDAELAARQEALRSQRMLLAPGGRGMVNAINELPDEWRNIAILDRITQGRVGGPTPIARDALTLQNMQRLMNSDVMAGNDPFRQQMARDQQQLREAQLPAKDRMALSRARGEPMGAGLSAGAVQSAWNSAWSEGDFIEQMEGAGYQLPEIQAWIDRKRNGGAAGPRPRADAPPPPGEGGPSTLDFAPGAGDMSF